MTKALFSAIVARGRGGAIGRAGDLPWHIPADLKFFKSVTLGKPVLMGRKTYESIGRPLPNRRNVIVTRQADYAPERCETASSLENAIRLVAGVPEIMLIGGGTLYAEAMPALERLYITEVDLAVKDADTFFPEIRDEDWVESAREALPATESHPALIFRTLDRR